MSFCSFGTLVALMKILLVEDSRILRERLRNMIAVIPNADLVAEADNEGDALLHLEKHRPDVAVLDIRLKTGSGLTVLEHIKAVYPETIIIVLTNYGQVEYRSKCIGLGAHYFFDKTRDIEAFDKLLLDLSQAAMATH
jgi:DNA-binding NarL/FixJ family response regulator